MTILHLLIEDSFIESFVESLPREKVKIVEEDFELNKQLLAKEMQNYKNDREDFYPYLESMKNLDIWFKESYLK
ncbi:hypothetical protein [Sulfurimonas sp.]|uniref:hypothetical protein n=1 Tax=Sulfurimonas sp. TaxID=2022749 RepID=UPI002AB27E95|nr:hypothetical protein [Sulfurimonas sp.]